MKKAFKYFAIAAINAVLLTAMLWLWVDKLELLFNNSVLIMEALHIMGCTMASLIAMRIAVVYFRKKNITNNRTKMQVASVITILISSYLYVCYTIKIADHNIANSQFRQAIAAKTKYDGMNREATNLSYKEYAYITTMTWFPKIDSNATGISFAYHYDGFLPDYDFSLHYYLPLGSNAHTFSHQKEDFSKYQTVDTLSDRLKLNYQEILQ